MSLLPDASRSTDPNIKRLYEKLQASRGHIGAMYGTLLNHPDLTEHVSYLGGFLRFHGILPDNIREFAILSVARIMNTPYEWVHHIEFARKTNLSDAIITKIKKNELQTISEEPYHSILEAVQLVLVHRSIPKNLQEKLVELLTIQGIIELVVLIGFYAMIAGVIGAFDVPLAEKEKSPW